MGPVSGYDENVKGGVWRSQGGTPPGLIWRSPAAALARRVAYSCIESVRKRVEGEFVMGFGIKVLVLIVMEPLLMVTVVMTVVVVMMLMVMIGLLAMFA